MQKNHIFLIAVLFVITAAVLFLNLSEPVRPSEGWTLHVDANQHIPGSPEMIAHHYCKDVAGGLIECQLYESDAPDARLFGIEVMVSRATYDTFGEDEKVLWHDHRVELARVEASIPDLPPEEADAVIKKIEETFGKVYILWNPVASDLPVGNPNITILR